MQIRGKSSKVVESRRKSSKVVEVAEIEENLENFRMERGSRRKGALRDLPFCTVLPHFGPYFFGRGGR